MKKKKAPIVTKKNTPIKFIQVSSDSELEEWDGGFIGHDLDLNDESYNPSEAKKAKKKKSPIKKKIKKKQIVKKKIVKKRTVKHKVCGKRTHTITKKLIPDVIKPPKKEEKFAFMDSDSSSDESEDIYAGQFGISYQVKNTKKNIKTTKNLKSTTTDLESDFGISYAVKKSATKKKVTKKPVTKKKVKKKVKKKATVVSKKKPSYAYLMDSDSDDSADMNFGLAPPSKKTKKKKKEKKKPQEKRLARKRSCTSGVSQRISRAMSQRLFMVSWEAKSELERKYAVLGSTGNLYNITIAKKVTCSCPDFGKGNLCKHILFVMIRVLKQARHCEYIWQRALLSTELREIFANAPVLANLGSSVRANANVRKSYNKLMGIEGDEEGETESSKGKQKPLEGNECPICLEDFESSDKNKVVFCKGQCGNNIHGVCWEQYKTTISGTPPCVFCRADWVEDQPQCKGKVSKARKNEGYLNFGNQSGQSSHRDQSSYSSWMGYHQSRSYGYRRRNSYRRW